MVKSRERRLDTVYWEEELKVSSGFTCKAVTEKEPGQGREQSSVVWLIIISNLVPQRSLKKSLLLEAGSQELAGCSCSRVQPCQQEYLDWIGRLP